MAKGSKQANMNRHIECCIESIEVHIQMICCCVDWVIFAIPHFCKGFHDAKATCLTKLYISTTKNGFGTICHPQTTADKTEAIIEKHTLRCTFNLDVWSGATLLNGWHTFPVVLRKHYG